MIAKVVNLLLISSLLTSPKDFVKAENIENLDNNDAPTNEYIVVFKNNIFTAQAKEALTETITKEFGCTLKRQFEIGTFHGIRVKAEVDRVRDLFQLQEVAHIERNIHVRAVNAPSVCYSERSGRDLWGLSRLSRRDALPAAARRLAGAAATYLWGDTDAGGGVDAYVLDTGIDVSHEEFEGRATFGYVSSGVGETAVDLNGHGTHVAGTLGSRTYGVAKVARLVAVKVLDQQGVGSLADVVEGLQWVVSMHQQTEQTAAAAANTTGPRRGRKRRSVANLSLSASGRSPALARAVEEATAAGVVVVVAAGNEASDACQFTPANVAAALTVGATTIDDKMADFSNYGGCVDLLAPGDAILSAYPDASTALASGTSQASPHVAGVVARILSSQEELLDPEQIKAILLKEATANSIDLNVGTAPEERGKTPNILLYRSCQVSSASNTSRRMNNSLIFVIAIFCAETWMLRWAFHNGNFV